MGLNELVNNHCFMLIDTLKRFCLAGGLLAALLTTISSCVYVDTYTDERHDVLEGDTIPAFSVETIDGHTVRSEVLTNTVSVIVFGKSGCGRCLRFYDALDAVLVGDMYIRDHVSELVVCIGGEDVVRELYRERDYSFKCSAQNRSGLVTQFVADASYPVVFFVNMDGTVARRIDKAEMTAETLSGLLTDLVDNPVNN